MLNILRGIAVTLTLKHLPRGLNGRLRQVCQPSDFQRVALAVGTLSHTMIVNESTFLILNHVRTIHFHSVRVAVTYLQALLSNKVREPVEVRCKEDSAFIDVHQVMQTRKRYSRAVLGRCPADQSRP